MSETEIKIVQTSCAVLVYIASRILIHKSIERNILKRMIHLTRGRVVKKMINFILLMLLIVFVLVVWGIDGSELLFFTSSVLAFVGIALFAQWSILSNITSGIILFFNHSIKLGDEITIMEKDYETVGTMVDITLFFVILRTVSGDEVTMPTNLFMQKMVKKTPHQQLNQPE